MTTGRMPMGATSSTGHDSVENAPMDDAGPADNGPSVVVYTDGSGTERVHPTSRFEEAITLAERLYNEYSITGARVFRLREIEIDLKVTDQVILIEDEHPGADNSVYQPRVA